MLRAGGRVKRNIPTNAESNHAAISSIAPLVTTGLGISTEIVTTVPRDIPMPNPEKSTVEL